MDEALEEIGHVSGEGGPLLLADLITVTSWRGVEDGGKDYERACDLLAEGPGVIRVFGPDSGHDDIVLASSELSIASSVLAILWAPEDGRAFESLDPVGLPTGEMSMGGTGLTLELAPGVYDCFHDAVANAAGDARRCHLVRRAG